MEKNINKHKTNHSLLVKNFGFIDNVLNKNIGEVDYKQDFGNQIGNVSVVNLNRPLSNYVASIRNKFKDYIQYAQELNPEMTFFFRYTPIDVYNDSILKASSKKEILEQYISKSIKASKKEGNFLDRTLDYTKQIVNEIGDITNGGTAQEILYAYDKLALVSRQYISYVDKLITESNDKGEYQFGYDITKNMIPHQLTRGYSYDSLREDVNDGVSILNNNSKVSYLHVYTNKQFGGSYNFIDSWDKAFNDADNLNYNFLYEYLEKNGISENPLKLHDKILNRYGRQLQSSKEFLREGNDLAVRYIFNTKEGFADTKHRTYAESNLFGTPIAGKTEGWKDGEQPLGYSNKLTSYNDASIPYEDADLVTKTNINFRNGRYNTMIARFSSLADKDLNTAYKKEYDIYQTAVSEYGLSHGRNLLRKETDRNIFHNGDTEKKYNDPYCRVWTNYHQYTHVRNQIRPFMKEENDEATLISNGDLYDLYGFNRIRTQEIEGFDNGSERLRKHGVMGDAGYVNITPKHKFTNEGVLDDTYNTKKCMFSIENLAWKGSWKPSDELNGLSKEQQGPNGGRIMWFPPYGLTFSENVNANWNETQFIGRGEKILSYTDTDRTGSLSFILLIDHPSILNEFKADKADGGVDELKQNDDEYDILRFFAGCGIPDLKERKPQELPKPDKEPEQPQPQEEPTKEETPIPQEEEGKFICMAFFPNNYSGVEDGFDKKDNKEDVNSNLVYGQVDPIVYLINGIMSQTALDGKETKNIMTDPKVKNYIGTDELIGYEIINNENKGISYYPAKKSETEKYLENTKQISTSTKVVFSQNPKVSLYITSKNEKTELYILDGVQIRKTTTKSGGVAQKETITWNPSNYTDDDVKGITPIVDYTYTLTIRPTIADEGIKTYHSLKVLSSTAKTEPDIVLSSSVKTPSSEEFTSTYTTKYIEPKVHEATGTAKISVIMHPKVVATIEGKTYTFEGGGESCGLPNMTKQFEVDLDFNHTSYVVESKTMEGNCSGSCYDFTLVPITGSNINDGHTNRWWYRIDADEKSSPKSWSYRRQHLIPPKEKESKYERYVDRRSFGLNSDGGIEKVYDNRELFHLSEDDIKDYYSLLDVYIASTKEEDVRSKMKENFSNLIDNEYYPKIEEIFKKIREGKIKISKIETEGYASSHGYTGAKDANLNLANNRAKTLKKWAETWDIKYDEINALELKTIDAEHQINVGSGATSDESALKPKLGRAAKMTVYFKGEALGTKQSQPDKTVYEEIPTLTIDDEEVEDEEKPTTPNDDEKDEIPTLTIDDEEVEEIVSLNITTTPTDTEAARRYGIIEYKGADLAKQGLQQMTNNYLEAGRNDAASLNKLNSIQSDSISSLSNRMWVKNERLTAHEAAKENSNYRYDNEYQFFKEIDINDSFVKHKIVEKVKYFDPAYHSISPEGFNSRLTFLHQCTRQGPTNGNSDFNANESQTAANLAFGRQPICILRVGDFYNTKIAIKSMNISYELSNGVQWDLNQEGIGVQPMFAKIDLSFTFLGGSDLAGPIARLQNAVSFNYYANTSVYDNRAEMIETNSDSSRYKIYNQGGKTISKTILTN